MSLALSVRSVPRDTCDAQGPGRPVWGPADSSEASPLVHSSGGFLSSTRYLGP